MRGLEIGERMIVVGGRYHDCAGVYLGVRPNGDVALRLDAREREVRYDLANSPRVAAVRGREVEVGTPVAVVGGLDLGKRGVFVAVTPRREMVLRLALPVQEVEIPAHFFTILLREPRPLWRKEPSAHTLSRTLKRINAPASRRDRIKVRATVADRTSWRHIEPYAKEAARTTHAVFDRIDRSDPDNWRPTGGSTAEWAACVRHNKRAAARKLGV